MARKRTAEDQEVLRRKLVAVDRMVSLYEERLEQCRAVVITEAMTQVRDDAPKLLQLTRQALLPVATTGAATSFIEDDLARVRQELGIHSSAEEGFKQVVKRMDLVAALQHQPDDNERFVVAVLLLAREVISFIEGVLTPARLLREQITVELNLRAAADPSLTQRQKANRVRDQRIREIAKQLETTSPSEVFRAAKDDPQLNQIQKAGARLTEFTVRDAMRRPIRRGKKRS